MSIDSSIHTDGCVILSNLLFIRDFELDSRSSVAISWRLNSFSLFKGCNINYIVDYIVKII